MVATAIAPRFNVAELQARFLTIMRRIETHARIYFRGVKCPDKKADRIAECVALAWKWFVRMAEQGKDATHFPSVLASFAARAVKSGRRVAGMAKAKDAMNENTQQRRGFVVGKLPDVSTLSENPLAEALTDNTQTPPPDGAAFRIDFPAWRRSLTRRNRRLIDDMMLNEKTMILARKHHLSPARVSQLRREFHEDWEAFTGNELSATA